GTGGRKGAVGAAADEDAGLLEQLPGRRQTPHPRVGRGGLGSVLRADPAAGEGEEAAEKAQRFGAAHRETLGRTGAARQHHAGGLGDRIHGGRFLPCVERGSQPGGGYSFSSDGASSGLAERDSRPRWTASSSRSIAKGLRM